MSVIQGKANQLLIPVDELAAFMNEGWPGVDWYLSDHAEYRWTTTFTEGPRAELYRPKQLGQLINLFDFEARVCWQGTTGKDPTNGRGYKLSVLFQRWQRTRTDVLIVAYVPREKRSAITVSLENEGGTVVYPLATRSIPTEHPTDRLQKNAATVPEFAHAAAQPTG